MGRAASEYRRREFQVALEHARTTSGLTFSAIKIVHERLGRGGKADALQGLGVHALIDDTASIVREAQKTGIAAFHNFPHFGPGGFANALENLGEFIESRRNLFRRQGACIHRRSTSRSSTDLHPSCPLAGYFESHCCKPLKPSLCAVQLLQLQAFDLQTNSQYSLATSLDKAP